ncbi:MAG TPA: hypothetical protein VMT00_13955 [Thermoanaerobaculia bacterium]|nr:hypothetical protein [Thermoanaerobaculia bacterium]
MEPKKSIRRRKEQELPELPGRTCLRCGAPDTTASLEVCRLCLRHFCPDCSYKASWGRFCSENCARTFFFGDSDEYENRDEGDFDLD